jgi:hypothetical protein
MKLRTEEEWKKFYQEHINSLSIKELSKKYGIHEQSFYTAFKRLNLPIKKRAPKRGANYNHNFFESIDSEIKAYLLGWIYSDGYLTTRNRVGIKLNKKDFEILELFKQNIAPGITILNDKNSKVIQFNSKKLYDDLVKVGVKLNKTYESYKLPSLDKKLLPHFIRGYFDGDGSISFTNKNKTIVYICSINKEILEDMKVNMPFNCKIYTEKRDHLGWKDMYRLMPVGGTKSIKSFYNYLYNNANYYLTRKFDKFNKLYGNTEVTNVNKEALVP